MGSNGRFFRRCASEFIALPQERMRRAPILGADSNAAKASIVMGLADKADKLFNRVHVPLKRRMALSSAQSVCVQQFAAVRSGSK